MAVNIDVNLDLDSGDIAAIRTELEALTSGLDFDELDVDDIISGDLDDVLDADNIEESLEGMEVQAQAEGRQSRVVASLLARINSELQDIHRAIKTRGLDEGGTLSTASFRDFQNWVSESDSDSDSDAEANSRGFDPLEIDTSALGSMDFGDGGDFDFDKFTDSLPMEYNQRPASRIIDTQKKIDPFAFIDRDRSDFGSSSISGFSSNIIDPRDKIDRDTAGIDAATRLNVDLDRDLNNELDIPDRLKRFRDRDVDQDKFRLGQDLDLPGGDGRRRIRRLNKSVAAMSMFGEVTSSVGRVLNRVRPRIGQIYNAIAALIPVLIGLAGSLAATGVAIGSALAVGGLIGILGAFGSEATTLQGTMDDLEDQMQSFKRSLFQAIQPAADTFGGAFDKALDIVLAKTRTLNDEFINLQRFEGLFLDGIRGTGNLLENLLQTTNRLSPQIQQLTRRYGGIIASGLPGFLAAATQEAFEHQNAVIDVLEVFWSFARVIYNASVVLLEFISAFSFLGGILSFVADLLNDRFVRALLIILGTLATLTTLLLGVGFAVASLNALLLANGGIVSALGATWLGGFVTKAIGGITTLIGWVASLNSWLTATLALLSAITLGGVLLAGGIAAAGALSAKPATSMPGGTGRSPATGSSTTNIEQNFYGDMDEQSRQRMMDVAELQDWQSSNASGKFGTR
jgi:hypothetical protein